MCNPIVCADVQFGCWLVIVPGARKGRPYNRMCNPTVYVDVQFHYCLVTRVGAPLAGARNNTGITPE